MPNPATPFGFVEAGLTEGIAPNFGIFTGYIATNNTKQIYGGDVAAVMVGGFYDVAAVVGGGAPIGGIFLPDFSYPSISLGATYRGRAWLGNTADVVAGGVITCKLIINPQARFRVRSNGAAITQANVGSNSNFVLGATPSNNLISTMALNQAVIGSGVTLPFTIVSIDPNPPSDATSPYNTVIVGFNNLANPH